MRDLSLFYGASGITIPFKKELLLQKFKRFPLFGFSFSIGFWSVLLQDTIASKTRYNVFASLTICSIMGNDTIYDKGLHETIKAQICTVLSQDRDFVFYFFPGYFLRVRSFPYLCYQTVKQIKKEFPSKMIRIVLLDAHPNVFCSKYVSIDDAEFFISPVILKDVYFTFNYTRIQKWMLQQSDYLFSYLYFDFDCVDQSVLKCLNRQLAAEKLKLVDLTAASTRLLIKEQVERLPARQKYVYEKLRAEPREPGLVEATAKQLGVHRDRVYTMYREICRNLRHAVYAVK